MPTSNGPIKNKPEPLPPALYALGIIGCIGAVYILFKIIGA